MNAVVDETGSPKAADQNDKEIKGVKDTRSVGLAISLPSDGIGRMQRMVNHLKVNGVEVHPGASPLSRMDDPCDNDKMVGGAQKVKVVLNLNHMN